MTGGGWEVRWSALLLVLLLCRAVVRRTSYEERERGQRRTAGEEAVLAEDGDRVDEEHGDVEEAAEEEHRGRMGCAHAMGGGAGRLGFVVVVVALRCVSLVLLQTTMLPLMKGLGARRRGWVQRRRLRKRVEGLRPLGLWDGTVSRARAPAG